MILGGVGDLQWEALSAHAAIRPGSRTEMERFFRPKFNTDRRSTAHSDRAVPIVALVQHQASESRLGQVQRLIEHHIKNRRKVAGRAVYNFEDFRSRGLLLQRLARVGDEARVFHRDDRLGREVL